MVEHRVKSIEWSQGSALYEVNGISVTGKVEWEKAELPIPDKVTLYQNYPNPFNPTTTIRFSLPAGMNVRIRIYNMLGETMAEAANGYYGAGYHEVQFNAAGFSSGIYYCHLQAGGSAQVKSMAIVK